MLTGVNKNGTGQTLHSATTAPSKNLDDNKLEMSTIENGELRGKKF